MLNYVSYVPWEQKNIILNLEESVNIFAIWPGIAPYLCTDCAVRAVARGGIGGVANPPNFCRINIFGKLGWPFGKLRQ